MSGWIRIEKSLVTDPRLLCWAKRLFGHAFVTHERDVSHDPVSHLLGCIVKLWVYADTHIDENDCLGLDPEDVDTLVGMPKFCWNAPPDWLDLNDDGHVILPNFQQHNGIEAKRKALQNKRQQRSRKKRDKSAATMSRTSVTKTSLDQDQDQDHKKKRSTNVDAKEIGLKPEASPSVHLNGWPEIPVYVSDETWGDWCAHRIDLQKKNKKGTWNPAAARATIQQLDKICKAGLDPNDCLSTAIAQGWQGVQLHYFTNRDRSNGNGKSRAQKLREHAERVEAESLERRTGSASASGAFGDFGDPLQPEEPRPLRLDSRPRKH